jgi:hypothetical protein
MNTQRVHRIAALCGSILTGAGSVTLLPYHAMAHACRNELAVGQGTMKTQRSLRTGGSAKSLTRLAGAAVLASVLAACSTTTRGQVALQQATPNGQTAPSGAAQFLGSDTSLLQRGGEGQVDWVYIASNVQWSQYKKVLVMPVEFWDAADSSVSPADQTMLSSYFYNSLRKNLQKRIPLAEQPGPGVVTLRVGIINAEAATPGLRSVSLVVPQARILDYAQSLATGQAAFAGSAEAAFKATDSVTGQLLGEGVDKRVGGMAVSDAAQVQWGDAEAAMDYWAQKITQRVIALHAGTSSATGQGSSY